MADIQINKKDEPREAHDDADAVLLPAKADILPVSPAVSDKASASATQSENKPATVEDVVDRKSVV